MIARKGYVPINDRNLANWAKQEVAMAVMTCEKQVFSVADNPGRRWDAEAQGSRI
jgi:hypothetical protein